MKRLIGIMGLVGLLGCAGPETSTDYLKKLTKNAAFDAENIHGRYTIEYVNEMDYFVCYKISEPKEEKFIRYLLSYFNTHYEGFLDEALRKTKGKMDKDGPFFNIRCVTLDGLLRTAEEMVPNYDEEIKNCIDLYKASKKISKIKVIGVE